MQKNVPYDVMDIIVSFNSWESTPSEALNKVDEQCERFLSRLQEDGFDIHKIQVYDADLDQNCKISKKSKEKSFEVTANIRICIPVKFNMAVFNHIKDIIKSENYDADIELLQRSSNVIEIRKELLKEAIADSKSKAEIIVAAMGQKILGIDKVLFGTKYGIGNIEEDFFKNTEHRIGESRVSDQLGAFAKEYEECVEVDWIIE